MQSWKHVHQRIEEHERGLIHQDYVEAYLLRAHHGDIESRLRGSQLSLHQEQVRKKWQVMDRVINVIEKQGLSYWGSEFEAAYTLEDQSIDHGNFLEMVMLLSMYDPCLRQHL